MHPLHWRHPLAMVALWIHSCGFGTVLSFRIPILSLAFRRMVGMILRGRTMVKPLQRVHLDGVSTELNWVSGLRLSAE
jgi:hypothetical protein